MNKDMLIMKIKQAIKEEEPFIKEEAGYDDHGLYFERGKVEALEEVLEWLEVEE